MSEVKDWIRDLNRRAENGDKNARALLKKITYIIRRAEADGTRSGADFCKHISGKIWEFRPDNHRILFFGWKGNYLVLLSRFRKQTRKTPVREIIRAETLKEDWIERHGN